MWNTYPYTCTYWDIATFLIQKKKLGLGWAMKEFLGEGIPFPQAHSSIPPRPESSADLRMFALLKSLMKRYVIKTGLGNLWLNNMLLSLDTVLH